ncbi:MAG: SPOR domain-containing protein [Brevirhabdus sp.]
MAGRSAQFTQRGTRFAVLGLALMSLVACEGGPDLSFLKPSGNGGSEAAANGAETTFVERDVEAPDVFQVTEEGLWDGRPSLGGVWVAHPTATDPERVIIRNADNGKFVIGALFRRERENPGPALQVSSDAADALGVLAGKPTRLNVTALRKEEVPQETPAAAAASEQIVAEPLDPLDQAAAAIDAAESAPAPAPAPATASAAPAPAPKPKVPVKSSSLAKPFIQIGFFSVEANANATGAKLRKSGIVPVIKKQTSKGKTFWRVLVGPAGSVSERAQLLKSIKSLGYADAYFVTN